MEDNIDVSILVVITLRVCGKFLIMPRYFLLCISDSRCGPTSNPKLAMGETTKKNVFAPYSESTEQQYFMILTLNNAELSDSVVLFFPSSFLLVLVMVSRWQRRSMLTYVQQRHTHLDVLKTLRCSVPDTEFFGSSQSSRLNLSIGCP